MKWKKRTIAIFAIILIMAGLSTLEKDNILRIISRLTERTTKLERLLSGVPISQVRIADLSANKITTGVLTLKDGSEKARLSVLDESNHEITTLDLNGITIKNIAGDVLATLNASGLQINGGNIQVKNDDDEIVFDVKGLVSTTNFLFDLQSIGVITVINPSSLTTISGSSQTITLPRDTNVLLMVSMEANMSGLSASGQVFMYIDGVASPSRFINIKSDGTGQHQSITLIDIQQLDAGSHTFELKCQQGGSENITFTSVSKVWITLGK